jgi:pilus assembly protein CpaB
MKPARIIVLVVAIAAGGIAAWLAGRSDQAPPPASEPVVQIETVDVLVANADIGLGQAVTTQALRWQTWPAAAATGPNFIRKSERADAINQLAGAIARQSFSPGEPIREARLIKAGGSGYMAAILPSGMRAVSTEISPENGVGGFILPNDTVDVMLTRVEKLENGESYRIETILRNVRVLAIDQTIEEKNGQHTVNGKLAILELTPRRAETLALARRLGSISLVLRSLVDSQASAGDDDGRLGAQESVNVVRFGRTTTTLK